MRLHNESNDYNLKLTMTNQKKLKALKAHLKAKYGVNCCKATLEMFLPDYIFTEDGQILHIDDSSQLPEIQEDKKIEDNTEPNFHDELSEEDNHLLFRSFFQTDNPHESIIASKFFKITKTLIVFGFSPLGNFYNKYSLWNYEDRRTNLIEIGKKEKIKKTYEEFDKYFVKIQPRKIPSYLLEYKDKLNSDGNLIIKPQLNLFE